MIDRSRNFLSCPKQAAAAEAARAPGPTGYFIPNADESSASQRLHFSARGTEELCENFGTACGPPLLSSDIVQQ